MGGEDVDIPVYCMLFLSQIIVEAE